MNIRKWTGILLVLGAAVSASAGSIGINFVGLKPDAQTLDASDTAGAEGVAQAHWNNLTISKDDPNGHNNGGHLLSVVDDAGQTVHGVTVTVGATSKTQVWPTNASSWGFNGANLTLQSGQLHPQARITVTDIPYSRYDVYAYIAAGDNAGQGSAGISVANDVDGQVDPIGTYFYAVKWLDGKFVTSTATTLEDAKASKGANCIRFAGNTASDFTLEWNGKLGGGWTGISGLQIVETPEQ